MMHLWVAYNLREYVAGDSSMCDWIPNGKDSWDSNNSYECVFVVTVQIVMTATIIMYVCMYAQIPMFIMINVL